VKRAPYEGKKNNETIVPKDKKIKRCVNQ